VAITGNCYNCCQTCHIK